LCLKPRNRFRALCAQRRLHLYRALHRVSWRLPDAPRRAKVTLVVPAIARLRPASFQLPAARPKARLTEQILGQCSCPRRSRPDPAHGRDPRAAAYGHDSAPVTSSNRHRCSEPKNSRGQAQIGGHLDLDRLHRLALPDCDGWLYPAQQDNLATSLSNVCAANFKPSTVVR
jgi:hypothetical protein